MKAQLLLLSIAIFLAINEIAIGQENSTDVAVISAIAPIYPSLACFGQLNGSVKLEVTINNNGDVIDTKGIDVESDIYRMFVPVSEYAAKRWKFVSTTNELKERKYIITFIFRLMHHDTNLEDITTIYRAPFEMEVRCRMHETAKFYGPDTSIGKKEEKPTNTR